MKKFGMIIGIAALSMLGACKDNDDHNGNMGTVHGKNCHCDKCMDKGNMGAVHAKDCACSKCKGNMGAVKAKDGCCSESKAGNMGAVSDKKGCGSAKSCSETQKN